jgi:hypothetical protein
MEEPEDRERGCVRGCEMLASERGGGGGERGGEQVRVENE